MKDVAGGVADGMRGMAGGIGGVAGGVGRKVSRGSHRVRDQAMGNMRTISVVSDPLAKNLHQFAQEGEKTMMGLSKSQVDSLKAIASKAAAMDELDDEAEQLLSLDQNEDDVEDLVGEEDPSVPGEQRLANAITKASQAGAHIVANLSTSKTIARVGVSTKVMQRVVLEDEWQLTSCLSMPMTLVFFVAFMIFFQQHYGTSFIHLQESNIRAHIGESATDINDLHGIFRWMKNDLVPYLWSSNRTAGRGTYVPALDGSEYQELVAGFLVHTQRSQDDPCDDDVVRDFYQLTSYDCQPMDAVQAQGFPNQQSPSGAFLGGWQKTASRRLLRAEDAEADDRSFIQSMLDHLEWLFPTQHHYKLAGSWTKSFKVPAQDSQDRLGEPVHRPHPEESSTGLGSWHSYSAAAHAARTKRRTVQKLEAASPTTGPRASCMSRSGKRRRHSLTRRGAASQERACHQQTAAEEALHKARKEYRRASAIEADEAAHLRQLRASRAELEMEGWIPYPYVKNDVWEYIVPMSTSQAHVLQLIDDWEQGRIIDRTSLFWGIEVMLRNPTVGNGLLSHVFINFLISRGGHIYVETTVQSLILEDKLWVLAFAIFWMMTLVGNSVATPARACKAYRRGRLKSHFKRFWNALEWFLIFCGWLLVIIFMIERFGVWKFNSHWDDYTKERAVHPEAGLDLLDIQWFDKIRTNVWQTGNVDIWLQLVVAYYHIFLILRFFVASRGQPRLAIVVRTITSAMMDLLHLLIVMMVLVSAYIVSGHILFGHRVESFATLQGSVAFCIQVILSKEFDFQELTLQYFWTSWIWIWTFVVLVIFVLVNIVLAMIFDTYGEVRSLVTDNQTLFSTINLLLKQLNHMSTWVSNRDLLMATKRIKGGKITASKLRRELPGIPSIQLEHLFDAAKVDMELAVTGKNAMPTAVASVLIGADRTLQGVKRMKGDGEYSEELVPDMRGQAARPDEPPSPQQLQDGCPVWVARGLLPFLREQQSFLDAVTRDVDSVVVRMRSRGVNIDVDPPVQKPSNPRDLHAPVVERVIEEPVVVEVRRQTLATEPPPSAIAAAL